MQLAISNVPFIKSFFRSQIGAITATGVDISSLFILTEYLKIYYVISAGIASGLGAIVSFTILRYWAFEKRDKPIISQISKYIIVSILILLLNMGGIYIFTDIAGFNYLIAKIIIAVLIGVFISFPLFRYWVYK
ncbi:MAG: GtrA family protein [Saprospiraceae bacterium]|nr:GtrA family protein [Bacteroidia bacterium]NNE14287.1 GtrA family protein [Saprospiraceae bacterium]NNL92958.1 GtrA family protein [Saprospiraceae bacterium]